MGKRRTNCKNIILKFKQILFNNKKSSLTIEEKQILKILISTGIPKLYRKQLWMLCSGAKNDKIENPQYYQKLVELSKDVNSLYSKQIEKDLKRTFLNNNINEEKINQLRRVLISYSIRNSSIGYCQGLNFIVNNLIEVLENEVNIYFYYYFFFQEDTFWVYCNIIEELLPLNFYSELCGVTTEQFIILNFLEKYFPNLNPILNNEIFKNFIDNLINQSLISLFVENLNNETTNFIWDCFFLEGNIVIIKVFIAIFSEIKNDLLKLSPDDLEGIKNLFTNKIKEIKPNSLFLLNCLYIRHFEFNNEYLEKIRESISNYFSDSTENDHTDRIQVKIKNRFNVGLNEQVKRFKECNKDWPYCYNDSYFENVIEVIKFLVLSPKNNPEIIDDYFFNVNKKNIKNDILINDDKLNLKLERRPHFCSDIIEEIKKERENEKEEGLNENDKEEQEGFFTILKKTTLKKAKELLGKFNPSPFFNDS